MMKIKKIYLEGIVIFLLSGFLFNLQSQSLSITPKPTYMGKITIGSSATRDVSIFNITGSNVNITSISLSGTSASKFVINNNPGAVTLSPLQELVLKITYTPTVMGKDISMLEIKTSSQTFSDSLIAYGSIVLNDVLTFERIIGTSENDSGAMIRKTNDGGYIIVGSTTKPDENYPDAYILKTDRFGAPLWSKIYGGQYIDNASDVLVLNDGSFIVVGTSESYGTGTNDVYVRKLNSNGDEIWFKSFTTTYDEGCGAIINASDGGYILTGSTKNTADKSSNALVMKIDINGNLVWKKDFGGNGGEGAGDILATNDGGYIFSGSTSDPSTGILDIYLVKIDASGNKVWEKSFGGAESDAAGAMTATSDGGYILGGYTASYGAGSKDAFMVKIDAAGNQLWYKTFGGVHSDGFGRVIQTSDGGYIGVGSINAYFSQQFIFDDLLVVRTDSQGNLIWQKTFGGEKNDGASEILRSGNGGYVILGGTGSFAPKSKIYLIGINDDGNITRIEDDSNEMPSDYYLSQNYPNPFNPTTQINFRTKEESFVNLSVFNMLGQKVRTLVNGTIDGGDHSKVFDASNLASGIYFYRLEITNLNKSEQNNLVLTKKMILIK